MVQISRTLVTAAAIVSVLAVPLNFQPHPLEAVESPQIGRAATSNSSGGGSKSKVFGGFCAILDSLVTDQQLQPQQDFVDDIEVYDQKIPRARLSSNISGRKDKTPKTPNKFGVLYKWLFSSFGSLVCR